jgi:hypothetical protein
MNIDNAVGCEYVQLVFTVECDCFKYLKEFLTGTYNCPYNLYLGILGWFQKHNVILPSPPNTQ